VVALMPSPAKNLVLSNEKMYIHQKLHVCMTVEATQGASDGSRTTSHSCGQVPLICSAALLNACCGPGACESERRNVCSPPGHAGRSLEASRLLLVGTSLTNYTSSGACLSGTSPGPGWSTTMMELWSRISPICSTAGSFLDCAWWCARLHSHLAGRLAALQQDLDQPSTRLWRYPGSHALSADIVPLILPRVMPPLAWEGVCVTCQDCTPWEQPTYGVRHRPLA
jgi:hypothetical protein